MVCGGKNGILTIGVRKTREPELGSMFESNVFVDLSRNFSGNKVIEASGSVHDLV